MAPYRLTTFGALSLCPVSGNAECKVGKSKLLLLAVIAAAGPAGIPRERIASLFWPDSDSDRSRNSLNQSLFALRRSVSNEPLVVGPDVLALNFAACDVDFVEFESAIAAGNVDDALALRAKPFLDGVRVSSSNELERWIQQKREALEALYDKGLRRAFDEANASHNLDVMLALAHKRVALAPYDAHAAAALVQALCDTGDVELAQRHAAFYDKLVRQDLEIEPDLRVAAIVDHQGAPGNAGQIMADAIVNSVPALVMPAPRNHQPDVIASNAGNRGAAIAKPIIGVLSLILAAVGIVSWKTFHQPEPANASGAETIAILPFCVEGDGASDLSNGMVDLLEASLPGDAGPRPLDPHASIAAANQANDPCKLSESEARDVSSKLGAARFILGGVVITGGNVVLSARVGRVSGAHGAIQKVDARGTLQNLHEVVGELSNKIQAVLINEPERRLPDILARSTPALEAYLHGRALWRSGQKAAAVDEYLTALDADSTFALAGYALAEAGGWAWGGDFESARRHLVRISATPTRLSARDRALLDAIMGNPPRRLSETETLQGWERAIELAPDSPTAWYEYGDRLYHIGDAIGRKNSRANAKAAFDKAVSLDSSYTIPIGHLVEIAINAGDTGGVRRYQRLYEAAGPKADYRQFIEWKIANFFHDERKRAALIADIGSIPTASLHRIAGMSQFENIDPAFGLMAIRELERRSQTPLWRFDVSVRRHDRAINDGNWAMAGNAIRQFDLNPIVPGYMAEVVSADALRMSDVLFGGADSTQVTDVVTRLERSAAIKPNGDSDQPRYLGENCMMGVWYARKHSAQARVYLRRVRDLRQAPGEGADRFPANPALCTAMIEGEEAVATGAGNAAAVVARLDSVAAIGLDTFGNVVANMETARLYYSIGDRENALRAVRRRRYEWTEAVRYLSASRSLEARILKNPSAIVAK